jgi:hypothetical protein
MPEIAFRHGWAPDYVERLNARAAAVEALLAGDDRG